MKRLTSSIELVLSFLAAICTQQDSIESRLDALLRQMTLEEKVAVLSGVDG
jgi:hypothetical protein